MVFWSELLLGVPILVAICYAAQAFLASSSPNTTKPELKKPPLARSIVVVIPTLNETKALPSTISRLFSNAARPKQDGKSETPSSITVIVVDASQDVSPTRACLSDLLAAYESYIHLVQYSGSPSRGRQLNFGAEYAAKVASEASMFVFLHADTYLPLAWDDSIFKLLSSSSQSPTLGCFRLSLPPPISFKLRIMLWFANMRATVGKLPYGDQCYFVTRADFEQLGKFPEVPIMEDVGLLRRVAQHGGSVEVLDASVETSKRRWEKKGVWWNTLLNQFLITAWLCGTPPETIYRWYYGSPRQSALRK